jgi:hypothetical protein
MQAGFTGNDDEQAILDLLENSDSNDLKKIFAPGAVNVADLNKDFHGAEWNSLQMFYQKRFVGGMKALLQGQVEPKAPGNAPAGMAAPAAIRTELDKKDEFRFDTGTIDNDDLSNTAIVSKIRSLDIFGKRNYLQRLEAQTLIENDKVKEYIRRLMPSTPWQAGATATTTGGFELQFENIKIVVKPDVFNSPAVAADQAHTEIQRIDSETYKTKPGFTWGNDQKVNSMTFTPFVPQLIYKVETHYGPQSDPSYTSGYGVGTRPQDTGGNTSIRFHEGTHGEVFIQFIRKNISEHSFPVFDGKLGDNKDAFDTKVEAYEKKVLAFDQMLKDAINVSEQQVDCVGKTIEQYYSEKKMISTVKCKTM